MDMKHVLIGINENKLSYRFLEVQARLRALGYYVKILKTAVSENHVPLALIDDVFEEEEQEFDLCLVGPMDPLESQDLFNLDEELADFLRNSSMKIIYADSVQDTELLVEKVQYELRDQSLDAYSFLFTIGQFEEHLTNNQFVGVYDNSAFVEPLLKAVALKGAHISVIASKSVGRIPFGNDVVYVEDKDELLTVLASKSFKYDFIINAIEVPRFSLAKGERFKVEYQRYFAEFRESYLPFQDEEPGQDNQLIVEVQSGHFDNPTSVLYLFENSKVDVVLQREFDREAKGYKPYVKLINKDKSIDIITYKREELLYDELILELIRKLEG